MTEKQNPPSPALTCPYCGSAAFWHSHRRGLFEMLILRAVLMRPFRCRDCHRRYYAFIFSERDGAAKVDDHEH